MVYFVMVFSSLCIYLLWVKEERERECKEGIKEMRKKKREKDA